MRQDAVPNEPSQHLNVARGNGVHHPKFARLAQSRRPGSCPVTAPGASCATEISSSLCPVSYENSPGLRDPGFEGAVIWRVMALPHPSISAESFLVKDPQVQNWWCVPHCPQKSRNLATVMGTVINNMQHNLPGRGHI